MHRSGTSAATRLVNLLGVPTGIEEDLAVPTGDNPRGYWESRALTAYNDGLLAALGCDWSSPARPEPGWEAAPEFEAVRTEASELFARVFPSEQWVWKDPRNCLTFAFWIRCLEVRPVVVLVHRNPLEIAASLEARDGLGKVYSLALWERYLRECLAAVSGLPTLVTAYGDLLSDPVRWCERASAFLEGAGVETFSPRSRDVLDFVDAELRHARVEPEGLTRDPDASEGQRALFLALEALVGEHASLPSPALPSETPTTDALLAERRRAYVLERELRRQYRELEDYALRLGERFLLVDGRR
jgi:hypothetical protein